MAEKAICRCPVLAPASSLAGTNTSLRMTNARKTPSGKPSETYLWAEKFQTIAVANVNGL